VVACREPDTAPHGRRRPCLRTKATRGARLSAALESVPCRGGPWTAPRGQDEAAPHKRAARDAVTVSESVT
jgi:hypothetical protein